MQLSSQKEELRYIQGKDGTWDQDRGRNLGPVKQRGIPTVFSYGRLAI